MKGLQDYKIMAQDQNTKRRTFCFIFDINNEQLLKGHGLITYGMAKFKKFDSITATYDNAYYPNLKYVPGVRLEFIPKIMLDTRWKIYYIEAVSEMAYA